MNPRFSILLLVLLLLAGGWIFFLQPHFGSTQGRWRAQGMLFDFASDGIKRVEIEREEGSMVFRRQPRGWRMESPMDDAASAALLEEILQLTSNLRAEERIAAAEFRGALRSGAYGFNPAKLRLLLEGPRGVEILEIGREASRPDRIFVRRGGSEETFVVPDTLSKLLLRPVDDYRDPRLVNLPSDLVERVRWQWQGATVDLQRHGTKWDFLRPLTAPADHELVEKLLENFLGAKVQEFVPPGERWGTAEVKGRIQLWVEGQEAPLEMEIAEEAGGILLAREDRPGFFRVEPENLALVTLPWGDLRLRRLEVCLPDLVDRFTITPGPMEGGSDGWFFQRHGKDWVAKSGAESKRVPGSVVAEFFTRLNQSRIEGFATGVQRWAESASEVAYTIEFYSYLSENTPEAQAGQFPLAKLVIGGPGTDSSGEGQPEENTQALIPARIEGSLESLQLAPDVLSVVAEFLAELEKSAPQTE
jgi:hypothetical protein